MNSRNNGFTLSELMIMVAIFGILLAVGLDVYRRGGSSGDLNNHESHQNQ